MDGQNESGDGERITPISRADILFRLMKRPITYITAVLLISTAALVTSTYHSVNYPSQQRRIPIVSGKKNAAANAQSLQDYNATASLEQLVENTNYRTFFRREVGDSEAATYEKRFASSPQAKQLSFPLREIHGTETIVVSPVPDNLVFKILEGRLNDDLVNYQKFVGNHDSFINGLTANPYRIVNVLPGQDPLLLPYKTDDGIVQIYVVNSAKDITRFIVVDNSGKTFQILKPENISGAIRITPDVKNLNGELQVQTKASQIFIELPTYTNNLRYEFLLDTALSEYTHSLSLEPAMKSFYDFVRKKFGVLDFLVLYDSWNEYVEINDGAVHAATLLYFELNPKNRNFVDVRLSDAQSNRRYGKVIEYYNEVHKLISEGRLSREAGPTLPLRALTHGLDYLQPGNGGLRKFAAEHGIK